MHIGSVTAMSPQAPDTGEHGNAAPAVLELAPMLRRGGAVSKQKDLQRVCPCVCVSVCSFYLTLKANLLLTGVGGPCGTATASLGNPDHLGAMKNQSQFSNTGSRRVHPVPRCAPML